MTMPAKGCKLNYLNLEDRMKTFTLPPQWDREWDGPLDYQPMAEVGFVYTGQEDLVYCFIVALNWTDGPNTRSHY